MWHILTLYVTEGQQKYIRAFRVWKWMLCLNISYFLSVQDNTLDFWECQSHSWPERLWAQIAKSSIFVNSKDTRLANRRKRSLIAWKTNPSGRESSFQTGKTTTSIKNVVRRFRRTRDFEFLSVIKFPLYIYIIEAALVVGLVIAKLKLYLAKIRISVVNFARRKAIHSHIQVSSKQFGCCLQNIKNLELPVLQSICGKLLSISKEFRVTKAELQYKDTWWSNLISLILSPTIRLECLELAAETEKLQKPKREGLPWIGASRCILYLCCGWQPLFSSWEYPTMALVS